MTLDSRHDRLLNAVEDLERLSLQWGDVDGSLSLDEVVDLAESAFQGEAEAAVEALIEACLLFPFPGPGGDERVRSRFAEMLRLIARLRQIFPGEDWRGAPPLVADFRVDLRERRYPLRDLNRDTALANLESLSLLQRQVWAALAPDCLAGFQVRATERLVVAPDHDTAVIVTAGTGSGKTLAFYLPTFLRLAHLIARDAFWVKAVAIYPRNELLKDQLTEAYGNVGKCDTVLRTARGRGLRIGTFYGDTPRTAAAESLPDTWARRSGGHVCPFLRCTCGGEMIWRDMDLAAARERLACAKCGAESDEERLALTRDAARRRPPDILFTTTEMMNRSLSDGGRRALFGLRRRPEERVRFVLLDEAHTYAGTSGAQAALTLRRWRALAGGPVSWVGLSATLEEAPGFFSDLTGVDLHRVAEVTPLETEMVEEGREYQLALRGDPASRASLLSSSIQAAMLIGRILDPVGGRSEGRFGRRLFAFTDDLDVTHRLFHDLRDAEGYDLFGRPRGDPLAALRAQTPLGPPESEAERRRRDADGQRWRLPEEVGRPLNTRLQISKTTARDPGVEGGADVIVATSALEVGFNDPSVGAVLQHKAPRSFASFVQRRGRAGRDRRMRPLTVTVLSDYGRDRSLFQSFEHLFDPTLAPQHLPVGNQYLLRMQATFAFLDWIADQPSPPNVRPGSVWNTASRPLDPKYVDPAWARHVMAVVGRVVKGEPEALASLQAHLRVSLGVDDAIVLRLLWEPPRSLLLEVAPTLARRLMRDWRLAWPEAARTHDTWIADHPLPEFAPRTLFADLNLPEVEIVLPPAGFKAETRESLPIQQMLAQFAPGRVSRRFGDAYGGLAHWIALPTGVTEVDLPVSRFAEHAEYVGRLQGMLQRGAVVLPVWRPWRVRLEKASPNEVESTSNAAMVWASGFQPNGEAVDIAAPAKTAWRGLIPEVRLYLQAFRSSVSVRRFAVGARAELIRPRGVEQRVDVRFVDDEGLPAALGYEFETDGLALTLALPRIKDLQHKRFEPHIDRGLRAAYLRLLVNEDPELPRESNAFQRAWLRHVHLLAVCKRALERNESVAEATERLAAQGTVHAYEEILDALLGVQDVHDASDEHDEPEVSDMDTAGASAPDRNRLQRLRTSLWERFLEPLVRERLHHALAEACAGVGEGWAAFILRTAEATMAEALSAAALDSAPRHAASDALIVDVGQAPDAPGQVVLWLTETTVGGAGLLQALAETFAREPRTLFRALEAALEPSDLECASSALARTFLLAGDDAEVAAAVDGVRGQLGHQARALARRALFDLLESKGVQTGRAFAVSLNARMLGPGFRREHDDVVRALLRFWEHAESQLGIELEARELAVLAVWEPTVQRTASAAGLFSDRDPTGDRAGAIAALLWPRTNLLRREVLSSYNPFRAWSGSDPAMVRALLLEEDAVAVSLEEDDWCEAASSQLAEYGTVRLEAPLTRTGLLRTALVRLPATPVTVGHLKLYPALERVSRDEARLTAAFVLREQV